MQETLMKYWPTTLGGIIAAVGAIVAIWQKEAGMALLSAGVLLIGGAAVSGGAK